MTMHIEQIVAEIREGKLPPARQCEELCNKPLIDQLRKLIIPDDWAHIRKLCDSDDEYQREFGIALVKNILKSVPEIKQYLIDFWYREGLKFRDQIALQFTLLNYEDLDPNLHKSLFNFILDDTQRWTEKVLAWEGVGQQGLIDYAHMRLTMPPKRKHWIYLCCLAVSYDKENAWTLISRYLQDEDPLVKEMAQAVAANFYNR
jgi:hypothetical protein